MDDVDRIRSRQPRRIKVVEVEVVCGYRLNVVSGIVWCGFVDKLVVGGISCTGVCLQPLVVITRVVGPEDKNPTTSRIRSLARSICIVDGNIVETPGPLRLGLSRQVPAHDEERRIPAHAAR